MDEEDDQDFSIFLFSLISMRTLSLTTLESSLFIDPGLLALAAELVSLPPWLISVYPRAQQTPSSDGHMINGVARRSIPSSRFCRLSFPLYFETK